jgi:Tol biopolymer transport system component/DNA-binding winged helix-turn-helix (wHTH) protein
MITFGPFRIDEKLRQLYRGEQHLKLEKIPLEILLYLIEERERVVSREEIADRVWGKDKFVEAADGINTAIRKIRRAIDDNPETPLYIQTVFSRGYRFIGEAAVDTVAPGVEKSESTPPLSSQRWRLPAAALVGLACLATLFAFLRTGPQKERPFASMERLTSDTGFTAWPDISPDGKLLAFASNRMDEDNLDIYVQPIEGGQPLRLTQEPSRDVAPVISPKGDQIAFESNRTPRGIYVVPLFGGPARLIARDGSRPRYSPNGKWIAYTRIGESDGAALQSAPSSWLVSTGGGEPRALRPELAAGNPVWAGNDFLILTGNPPKQDMDWWVTPLDGSWAKPMGVHKGLIDIDLVDVPKTWHTWTPEYFENNSVVFSARTKDGANLWKLRLAADFKPIYPPERVTLMSDHVRYASASSTGRIAAAVVSRNIDIYEVPLDANTGTVRGKMNRLTQAKTTEQFVSISADGKLLAFTSWRKGEAGDLFLLNRETGVEKQVTATDDWESWPTLSPDGQTLFYKWSTETKWNHRRMDLATGKVDEVCAACLFMDVTADKKSFLYGDLAAKHIFLKDFAGGPPVDLVHDPAVRVENASLDGTNRWIAFVTVEKGEKSYKIHIAPFRRDGKVARKDWIAAGTGFTPLWSPNGEWLYFDDSQSAFRSLWAQQFDPRAGRLIGERKEIARIHGDKRLITALRQKDRGLARDRIVFSINEETANIWLMK